jgi:hypothetical protein
VRQALEAEGVAALRLGEDLLVLGDAPERLPEAVLAAARSFEVRPRHLHLVIQKGRLFQREWPEARVLIDRGRYLVVEADASELARRSARRGVGWTVEPLRQGGVALEPAASRARAAEPWVQSLVERVSESEYGACLKHLVSYPTRHSRSDPYADVANWARQQLEADGYLTRIEPVQIDGGDSYNVEAERIGHGRGERGLVLVCAHLDSINDEGGDEALAPGATDNATGCAGVLHLARILAGASYRDDLRLLLLGGGEQGFLGGRVCVGRMSPEDRRRTRLVIDLDLIGGRNPSHPGLLLEGAADAVRRLAEAASTYSNLDVLISGRAGPSDCAPFLAAGLPAVLATESTAGAASEIHTERDTLEGTDTDLALEIVRMALAATAIELGRPEEVATSDRRGGLERRLVEQLKSLRDLIDELLASS